MNALQIQRTNEVKSLLKEMSGHYKMTVVCAVKIGRILVEQKEELGHGHYLKWLESEIKIPTTSAERYSKLYTYKITNVGNLSEAYKQIEDLETKKRQQEFAENNRKIEQFQSTGVKPSDWDRQTDYQYKKAQEDKDYLDRKRQAFIDKQQEERERRAKIEEDNKFNSTIIDDVQNMFNAYEEKINKLSGKSLGNDQNDYLQANIFEAIDKYILSFSTPSDKIMAGQNIIKHTKEIINSNQVKSIS